MTTVNTEDFIGKSKYNIQNTCEFKSLIFRLVSVDDEVFLGYPEDKREDRVCVELKNGVCVKATVQ